MASMVSKKKARWPPSRYCTLCLEVAMTRSSPASSIRRSSRLESNGMGGAADRFAVVSMTGLLDVASTASPQAGERVAGRLWGRAKNSDVRPNAHEPPWAPVHPPQLPAAGLVDGSAPTLADAIVVPNGFVQWLRCGPRPRPPWHPCSGSVPHFAGLVETSREQAGRRKKFSIKTLK